MSSMESKNLQHIKNSDIKGGSRLKGSQDWFGRIMGTLDCKFWRLNSFEKKICKLWFSANKTKIKSSFFSKKKKLKIK